MLSPGRVVIFHHCQEVDKTRLTLWGFAVIPQFAEHLESRSFSRLVFMVNCIFGARALCTVASFVVCIHVTEYLSLVMGWHVIQKIQMTHSKATSLALSMLGFEQREVQLTSHERKTIRSPAPLG